MACVLYVIGGVCAVRWGDITENKAPFIVECVVAFKGTFLALVDSSASRGILKFDAWDDVDDLHLLIIVDGGAGARGGGFGIGA